MRTTHAMLSLTLIAGALTAPLMLTGCATHSGYDVAYSDHHVWNESENGFYVQWETDTHRQHREWNQRNADEQREYWSWRQTHS